MSRVSFGESLKDDHIFRLTDDTGILQHSKYGIPDPVHGYTTDDNARALIMALMLYEKYRKQKYLDLVYRYSSFLLNARSENGRFRNLLGYDRRWLEDEGSEDCFGRSLWALGFAVSNKHTPQGVKNGLAYLLENAVPHVLSLKSPRAKAYAVIGLACLKSGDSQRLLFEIARSLWRQYMEYRDGEWKWFENIVAYSNSVLPRSLFKAYRVTGEKRFLEAAEESLTFIERITFRDGYFKPVGCRGWFMKGGKPADFDEQPIEACETGLAYLEAYTVTGKRRYKRQAERCHAWYEGVNSKGVRLIDYATGGCYDGLTAQGVNSNMGAESLISYFISYCVLRSENFRRP